MKRRLIGLGLAFLLTGCGASEDGGPSQRAPSAAGAKSPASSAFPDGTVAPAYNVTLEEQNGTGVAVLAADFGQKLPEGASVSVKGVELAFKSIFAPVGSPATQPPNDARQYAYSADVPQAADGLYTFVLDVGGHLYTTQVNLDTHMTSPVTKSDVAFHSPSLLTSWDPPVAGNGKGIVPWLDIAHEIDSACVTTLGGPPLIDGSSAAFEPVFDGGSSSCDLMAGATVYETTALTLGHPFLTGELAVYHGLAPVTFTVKW